MARAKSLIGIFSTAAGCQPDISVTRPMSAARTVPALTPRERCCIARRFSEFFASRKCIVECGPLDTTIGGSNSMLSVGP